ncbi:putative eka-like protein [Erysiphe necator]|uniref:Putative eka-like protein n=1 Tax=Uncinula necator TaxID=52586 RepID=A0A0B1P5S5_UNCNE|nr:putative eka-like protein [Erysiphe necator]
MIDTMDITQEIQAPSTETSFELPPIPNNPPVPYPLPSTTSPTPPSNSQTLNNITASRKILKPAVPTKRPIPERPSQNSKNSSDDANAFLPRELAEIVATRQRRERAWHTRLMICTTIHSCIENNLSNFSNEIEKEEAAAFKAYIQMAIAKFAAVDSSPSSPQIPTHTRPTKRDGTVKEKSFVKKAVMAPPLKPTGVVLNKEVVKETSNLLENTRATVARAGQKKARVILSGKTQMNPTGRQPIRPANKVKSNSSASQNMAITDKRLFVRLTQEHEWRKLSAAGIREVIVKKLHISPSLIGKIKPIRSGFALIPCSCEAREEITKAESGLFLSGAKLETATN